MCKVYNAYSRELVFTFNSIKDAENWIGDRAEEWNYGTYRTWEMAGYRYYDVGPRTYMIAAEDAQ